MQSQSNRRTKLDKWQRIFVNRSLNMANIKAIGFDMDHTLAMYNRETFEALAFRETVKKFIQAGYPSDLESLQFKPDFLIRGLLVDMERGNLLKVDGHKYVKIAFHGHRKLDKETRQLLYNSESFKAFEMLSVDTFFALSEVQLFTEIVDYMEANPGKIRKSYREVYGDLRTFIDRSHADGSIKNEVLRAPEKFIRKDKHLATTLIRQIDAGKQLFLLTNSAWEYTNQIMSYLLDGEDEEFPHWRDYFTYAIVSAAKPGFFMENKPFFEVVTESNLLKIQDGPFSAGRVYHGGNANLFQRLAAFRGDQILYVGDHIYGDIARSKGLVNWRTMLLVEEFSTELPKLEALKPALADIRAALERRETFDEELQLLRSKITSNARQAKIHGAKGIKSKSQSLLKDNERLLEIAREREDSLAQLDLEIRKMIEDRESQVHPVWGELMKVGLEQSRFADQVEAYACIYTSMVSNLRYYSPYKRFTPFYDLLPHDI